MEDLLLIILQFLFECIIESLAYMPFNWPTTSSNWTPSSLSGRCFLWSIVGGGLGGISLLLFPHTFIRLSSLRMINLVVAPLMSGWFSRGMAIRRAKSNPAIEPAGRFWQAFWFTLGLVIVRFMFAQRVVA